MSSRIVPRSLFCTILAVPIAVSCSSPDNPGEGDDNGTGGNNLGGAAGVSTTGGTPTGGASGAGVTGGASGAGVTGGASGAGVTGGASGAGVTGGASGAGVTGGAGGADVTGGAAGSSGAAGDAGAGNVAGVGGAPTGGAAGIGGTGGVGGTSGNGGTSGGGGMGGTGGRGGSGGTGGSGVAGSFVGGTGGMGGAPMPPPLDCGGKGQAIENNGPVSNRVNYAIIGDGYSQAELDTTYIQHIQTYMTKRFSDPIGQPYLRYRKFVNICAVKVPSTPICGSSTFGCCGDDNSRLATCTTSAVNAALSQNLPASFEIDWRALVLNGSSWWNTGAQLMLWSGGNRDAAGAALHEGGHGHHQLADEYGDCNSQWINNTNNNNNTTSGGKWDLWIGYNQVNGTGATGFYACTNAARWRPTSNSMMNSLFGNNVNTSFNAPSREKMIMDIWRIITNPWDSVVPPAGAVTNPATLTVNVIDPLVVSVDWTLDGNVIARNGGPTYNVRGANLAPGTHTITARAYDNATMDLVRQTTGTTFNRQYWNSNAQKTVSWTVTIP